MSPEDLAQVLRRLPASMDPSILSGFHAAEDVGIVRLEDGTILVQSVDFFTPIVDDPYQYGAIAAANSLSDLYTAGAQPLTALSVLCYPDGDDLETLAEILTGGHDKLREAGAHLVGGHSVSDDEIKFGLAVTGVAPKGRYLLNSGARPGDVLVLTKPLGTGILSTAIKAGKAPEALVEAGIRQMARLNADAARAMMGAGAHAATDITGFGLAGHAFEMARASEVTLILESGTLPLLPGILDLAARKKFRTRGSSTNRDYVGESVEVRGEISSPLLEVVFDPQTSGGLLISLPPESLHRLEGELEGSETEPVVIGRVETAEGDGRVVISGNGHEPRPQHL